MQDLVCDLPGIYLPKLSEKSLTHLRPSLTNCRRCPFRLLASSLDESNSHSEYCSNPFSDSFRVGILGSSHSHSPSPAVLCEISNLSHRFLKYVGITLAYGRSPPGVHTP